ncbi:PREDICTED: RING-box protein 2 [Chaetura pelagica]|uniref:RING-box protein 2 n=1 Tax=Chaetura pelagica TaxID=8897 RepID=UPI000523EC5E|nr:PREDICTED: RING-box protein 2 [Chaetura pelagica]
MSKLQKLEEACGSIAVYQGPRKEPDDYSNFTIEDSVATFHTLKQIIDTVEKLNESHDKYRKKRSSSAKYGIVCRVILVVWGECNHSFHNCCMSLWVKQNNRCPLCQQDWVVQRIGK